MSAWENGSGSRKMSGALLSKQVVGNGQRRVLEVWDAHRRRSLCLSFPRPEITRKTRGGGAQARASDWWAGQADKQNHGLLSRPRVE